VKKAEKAIDDLLAPCLEDQDALNGTVGSGGKWVTGPRICDFAAKVIALRRDQPDSFDFFGNQETRDRQIAELKRRKN